MPDEPQSTGFDYCSAELVLDQKVGVEMAPKVDEGWFDRFD